MCVLLGCFFVCMFLRVDNFFLFQATCCSDQEHCCPHGYTCKDGGCEKEPGLPFALPAFTPKLFLKKEKQENERDYPQVMLLP